MRKIDFLRDLAAACIATALLTACVAAGNTQEVATPSSAAKEDITAEAVDDAIKSLSIARPGDFGMIKLANYKNLAVTVPVIQEVTDEDVAERIRTTMSDMREPADVIENGYFANINFVGKMDGQEFDGGSADDYTIEIGSGTFIDGFEDALIGLKVDDVKDVSLTFPEDYYSEDLAGKDVVFTVTVNEISKIPELTDEIAHKLNDSCDTADKYRTLIRENLVKEFEFDYVQEKGYQALSDVKALSEVSVSDAAIDWAGNLLITQYYVPTFALYYETTFAEMLEKTQTSIEAFKEGIYDQAKQMAEDSIVIEAIAEKEGIELTDSNREDYAANFGITADELIERFGAEYVDFNVKQYEVYKVLNDNVIYTYTTE